METVHAVVKMDEKVKIAINVTVKMVGYPFLMVLYVNATALKLDILENTAR